MTQLNYWYQLLTVDERTKFRQFIITTCGVSEDTARRYLTNEAPKLTKHMISDYTKISIDKLYKQLEIKP